MVRKINSPSRAASHALTISVTDLSLINFETAVSCFFPRPPIGLYSKVSGTYGRRSTVFLQSLKAAS